MKSNFHRSFFAAITILFVLQSCQKDNAVPAIGTDRVGGTSIANATSGSVKKLTLQPGPTDGDDSWLTWKQNDASYANTNWDTVNMTAAYAWTSGGIPINGRSLIKFDGLSSIPASSLVISARLYMYGIPSNIHLTAGNSIYPGTPYTEDNSMTVLRVLQPWNQSTVTWNTQPNVTLTDRVVIPTSTSQWNYDANVDVTPLVAAMVAQPARNYGFMFRMALENRYKCMLFSSSDYTIAERRPKLVVVYK